MLQVLVVAWEVLVDEPVPVARINPEAPVELEQVITKALTKDRKLRFQTAGDLEVALVETQSGDVRLSAASGSIMDISSTTPVINPSSAAAGGFRPGAVLS